MSQILGCLRPAYFSVVELLKNKEIIMELGFIFYPPGNPQALGHPQLDVNLLAAPTGEHFDPRALTAPITDPRKGVQHITYYHPAENGNFVVSPGEIVLLGFDKKVVEAYSFGGFMHIQNYPDHTLCQITSSAPIFDTGRFAEDELELINEYEAELARLRATWQHPDLDLEQRLADFEPKTLFQALTISVQQRLHKLPASSRNDHYWQMMHTITAAIRFIEPDGQFPNDSPALASLL
jgi:hypothetical protein